MSTSQNGWPASSNKAALGVVNFVHDGVSFPGGVKSGDVATVLGYVVDQFHTHVEKLHAGWCWGYDWKPIEGSSTLSNHASGTAVDINAPKHPMGSHGTFTSAQVAAIRKILNFCGGVVRWGGDYTGRKDEMHFEINKNSALTHSLAMKIKGTPVTPPPVVKPPVTPPPASTVIKKGSTGSVVLHIQQFLNSTFPAYKDVVPINRGHLLVADAIYGDATAAWIKEFQRRVSLPQDGIVGAATLAKLRGFGYKY